jgi:hypothetical protein
MSLFGSGGVFGGITSFLFGDGPAPPDTSGINNAAEKNAAVAARAQTLAEQQYADQLKLWNEWSPMLKDQLQKSIAAQDLSTQQSKDAWSDYTKTWQPVEQQLAKQSLEFASPGRANQEAATAQAGVAQQYDAARTSNTEDMIRAGLDPSAIASLNANSRLLQAKDTAVVGNNARRTVESQGLAYLDNAARFGRNMTSTGLAAAGLATQQGGAVQSGYGNLVQSQAAPTSQAIGQLGTVANINQGVGSLYSNAAGLDMQGAVNTSNFQLGSLGALAKLGGAYYGYTSSKKTKHRKGKVNGLAAADAVEKSGASRWSYKPGMGDGNTKARMGPMAEDLKRVAPEVSDGKTVDGIAMHGLHHAAIGGLNKKARDTDKRLAKIERRLSLADA